MWVMRLYMTSSDHDIFECLTHKTPEAKVEEATQPHPSILTPTPDPRPSIPLADEPAALTTGPAGLADELAVPTAPLEAANNVERAKDSEYTNWAEIHPSHQAACVGHIPPTLGDLRWHHHACSSSQRRACCHPTEEQWGNKDNFTLASFLELPRSSMLGERRPWSGGF